MDVSTLSAKTRPPHHFGGRCQLEGWSEPRGRGDVTGSTRSTQSLYVIPGPAPAALERWGRPSVAAVGRGARSVIQGMSATGGGNDDHLLMRRATGQLCENRSRVTGEVTSWGARFRYEGQRRYLTLEAESREEAVREMALLMFRVRRGIWEPPRKHRRHASGPRPPKLADFAEDWLAGEKETSRSPRGFNTQRRDAQFSGAGLGMRHTPKWTVKSMVRRPGLLLPAPFGGLPVSAAIRVEAIEEVHHRVDDVGVALGQSR
jgi:hypothetical protein